jgi:hypothetical protein
MTMSRLTVVCTLLIAATGFTAQQAPQIPSDKSWVVEGKVVDDSGPVPEVSMKAIGRGQDGKDLEALTDQNGHFILTATAPGKYSIYPAKDGYEGGEEGDSQKAISVDLAQGTHLKDADFVIHKAASISGRILDPNRNPLPGAAVVLYAKQFGDHRQFLQTREGVESDASGDYHFAGLRAGTYYLAVHLPLRDNARRPSGPREPSSPQPMTAPVRTYYPNSTSFDNAAAIYLGRAEHREGVDMIMNHAPTFCVTGNLSPGVQYSAAKVRLAVAQLVGSTWAGFVGSGDASPGEDFEVCDLPPGSYVVSILAIGKEKLDGFVSRAFTVANRDVAVGELYLQPPAPLRGKMIVADAPVDGSFPVGVRVEIRSLNRPDLFAGEGMFGHPNSKGEFLIEDVLADDFRLRVGNLPRSFYLKSVTQGGRDVTSGSIRPGDDLTITLCSEGPVVTGETVDQDDVPVRDATVILIPKDQSLGSILSLRSGRTGGFQFQSGIVPGEYSIVALTDLFDGDDQNPDFVRDQMTRATQVALDRKETKSLRLVVRDAHQP